MRPSLSRLEISEASLLMVLTQRQAEARELLRDHALRVDPQLLRRLAEAGVDQGVLKEVEQLLSHELARSMSLVNELTEEPAASVLHRRKIYELTTPVPEAAL